MKYLLFRQKMTGQVFFSIASARLADRSITPFQLKRWETKGYINGIIKGWYRFTDTVTTEEMLLLIANKLVTPSYISLASALSFYNVIPEGVFQITSITSKKTTHFNSSLGRFDYRHIKPLLMFGYTLCETSFGQFRMADLEKALLDFLYLTPEANNVNYFEEMRFNQEILKSLDHGKFSRYLNIFNQKKLSQRAQRLLHYAAN